MTKFMLLTIGAALSLAACASAPPPPPPPPPPPVEFNGLLTEKAGVCFTIMGDNGTAYAVHPGGPIDVVRVRARVHVVGVVAPMQDCPGRVTVRADRVDVLGGAPRRPPPRRPRGPDPK